MDQTEGLGDDERFRRYMNARIEFFNVPLMRNEKIIERPAQQTTITRRYTDEGIAFITAHRDRPFFLYLAHNFPHMPLFRSKEFEGISARGLYGDAVEEIDSNVGRILTTLRDLRIDENTLVLFMSDNGPWAPYLEQGGSAGLLRGAKGLHVGRWHACSGDLPVARHHPEQRRNRHWIGARHSPYIRQSCRRRHAERSRSRRLRSVLCAPGEIAEPKTVTVLLREFPFGRAECRASRSCTKHTSSYQARIQRVPRQARRARRSCITSIRIRRRSTISRINIQS